MIDRQNIEDVFDDCLNRLHNGQDIESILRLYPEYSQRLRALLELSQATVRLNAVPPQEVALARDRTRFRLLQAMEETTPPIAHSRGFTRLLSRVAIVLIFGFVVMLIISQNSLPGDTLYGVKQFTQDIRGTFGTDPQALEQERFADIQAALDSGRIVQVSFEGTISAIDDDVLLIESFKVRPPSNTSTALFVGALVEVNGITTSDGFIVAGEITVIVPADPTPTPTASATMTVTATMTATATFTNTPEPSPSHTVTASPSSTATPTQLTPVSTTTTVPPTSTRTPIIESSGECVPQRPDGWVTYAVRSGDTLSSLAVASDTSLDDLREVNCLETSAFIVVGQLLFLEDAPRFNTNDDNGSSDNSDSSDNSGSGNSGSSDDDSDDDNDDDDHDDDIDEPDEPDEPDEIDD